MRHLHNALLVLPLALAISACADNPEATQEVEAEEAAMQQPGFDETPATPEQAQEEARTLAAYLSSADLTVSEAEIVLDDLATLVNDHMGDFPADIRVNLSQDIESARDALESDYMRGMQEAAAQIENRLALPSSVSTIEAVTAAAE